VPEEFAVFLFQGERGMFVGVGGATGEVAPIREALDFLKVG
jgi:hypothetical protein